MSTGTRSRSRVSRSDNLRISATSERSLFTCAVTLSTADVTLTVAGDDLLHGCIASKVLETPDHPAIEGSGQAFTFGDLDMQEAAEAWRCLPARVQVGFRRKPLVAALDELAASSSSVPIL